MTIREYDKAIVAARMARDYDLLRKLEAEQDAAIAAWKESVKPVYVDLSAELAVLWQAYDAAMQEEADMWATVKPHPGTGLRQHNNAGVMRRKTEAAMNAYWAMYAKHNPEPKPLPKRAYPVPDNFNCLDYTDARERRRDKQEEKDELMEYQRAWQGLS